MFRDQCEELRSILTKRHQDVVCEEREEQRRVKEEQKYRQQKGTRLSLRKCRGHEEYILL